jgi:hypothetical protein
MANTKRRREKHRRWRNQSPRYRTIRNRVKPYVSPIRKLEAERAEREARMRAIEDKYPEEEKPMNNTDWARIAVLAALCLAAAVVAIAGALLQGAG